jgi:hypothetical protein
VTRPSLLIITFGAQADTIDVLYCRALVDSTDAQPATDQIILSQLAFTEDHTLTFYQNANTGLHTVSIQWRITNSTLIGKVWERTLTVIGLPS